MNKPEEENRTGKWWWTGLRSLTNCAYIIKFIFNINLAKQNRLAAYAGSEATSFKTFLSLSFLK